MLRLSQYRNADDQRQVLACDDDARAYVISGCATVLELATLALHSGITLQEAVTAFGRGDAVDLHDALEAGRLLPPIDHPDPAHLVMTGTGLTHLGSAEGRDQMHRAAAAGQAKPTDSMRMFQEGLEGGRPALGAVGCQPEWFYKGDGGQIAGPGQPLDMPSFAQDGGEEPELAGIYLIGPDGEPWRLGLCLANEFSDHVTERHNYLWLAHSKLRPAALGAELLVGEPPADIVGRSRILRAGDTVWEKPFHSGEANMSHSLANLEHHHFKYRQFRRPGDVHVHFFGTATLSFSDGFATQIGDVFEVEAAPFHLPLRNPLAQLAGQDGAVQVRQL